MSTSKHSIYAALSDGSVWSVALTSSSETRTFLGIRFTAFAVSPYRHAVAVGSDDGELFLIDNKHGITAWHFERDLVTCVAFEKSGSLLACAPGGRVLRIIIPADD
jgi:hypothetical protein